MPAAPDPRHGYQSWRDMSTTRWIRYLAVPAAAGALALGRGAS
ncbi:MAG: hypothetical protein ACRDT0_01500 [Pseudonocardiaceae bacterium]